MKKNKQYSNSTYLILGWIASIIGGIFSLMGLISFLVGGFVILIFSIPLLFIGIKLIKTLKAEEKQRIEENQQRELEIKQKEQKTLNYLKEMEEKEKQKKLFKLGHKEEFDRLNSLCKDIHNEYKELLREYKGLEIEDEQEKMLYILKECYRKLEVIQERQEEYDCYNELFVYDEMEKIKKKAKTFINKYIKLQKEEGYDNDMIDIMQFYDDLYFIYDYIDEKYEKLNK